MHYEGRELVPPDQEYLETPAPILPSLDEISIENKMAANDETAAVAEEIDPKFEVKNIRR